MSEPEKPLHVKVAEVLGAHIEFRVAPWFEPYEKQEPTWMRRLGVGEHVIWPKRGICAVKEGEEAWTYSIPRYDTDWSVTGPLIVMYRLAVAPMGNRWRAALDVPNGHAVTDDDYLPAVCRLILALKAAGKLVWKVSC